jgi:Txe/YoeB family toxin of toxin-antitoxin system
MVKHTLSTLLSIALVIAPFPQASAATAKSGATCTKQKATSIVKGKKFTCIKSGKKLIWDKGVVVKATVTKPSPTPNNSIPLSACPKLVQSAIRTPESGIGHPEQLTGQLAGAWSRRITAKDRLVYFVEDDTLVITQARFHYEKD